MNETTKGGKVVNMKPEAENDKKKTRFKEEHEPRTAEQIVARIDKLKGEIEVANSSSSESKDEFIQERANEIVFLDRLLNYVKQRQKADPGQVLFPTSEKGLLFLYNELKGVLDEFGDDEEFAEVIPDLERNVRFLYDILRSKSKSRKANGGAAIYDKRRKKKRKSKKGSGSPTSGTIKRKGKPDLNWFTYYGYKIIKPENIVIVSEEYNVLADDSLAEVNPRDETVKKNVEDGSVTLILRLLKRYKSKDANGKEGTSNQVEITVTLADIQVAREQRFTVALAAGGVATAASLIVRDLGRANMDGRVKKPETIIERYKEDFLAAWSWDIVLRDVQRIVNIQS